MINDWWKWGDPKASQQIGEYPKLKAEVEERWKVSIKEDFYPTVKFQPKPITEKEENTIRDIFATIPSTDISFKEEDRLAVALGKSYYDIIRIFKDSDVVLPDVVISPNSHDEIQYVLTQAVENNIYIIPFGGGTNVVGALSLDNLSLDTTIVCTLDLRKYNELIEIDETNMLATFQAGILGPKLEGILNKQGYTLGHFPQSFEFSTLGGWLVTRSAGQESTYFGKIENLVESIKVATPVGTIKSNSFSRDASGINVLPFFVGSEGTLGVVSEVTVKIQKLPQKYHWIVALFPSFEQGTNYLKDIIQSGVKPSVARLSDAPETRFFSKLSSSKNSTTLFDTFKKNAQKLILDWKNLTEPCALLLRIPEGDYSAFSQVLLAKRKVKKYEGMLAPATIGDKWAEGRFKQPYLRDSMIQHSIYVDTMETLVRWEDVSKLHAGLTEALSKSDDFNREKGILLTHISHIYPNAASMYFMLFTPMKKDRELEQWKAIKELVTDTIHKYNGTVSHHHSVGLDHQKWYLKQTDDLALDLLRSVKKRLDPKGIMNPGKLYSSIEKHD